MVTQMIDQIQARELNNILWKGFRDYLDREGAETFNQEMATELWDISVDAWKYWKGRAAIAKWLIPLNGGYYAA